MTDALGSVRQLTDASGAVTYTRTYDPYGLVTTASGSSASTYGFSGEYTSNNLVYLRARQYAPGMGRFLTRDTWGGDGNSPMSFNRWNYTASNPINRIDPSGHCYNADGNWNWWMFWEWSNKGLCPGTTGTVPATSTPTLLAIIATATVCTATPSPTSTSTSTATATFTPTSILEPWRLDPRYNSNSRSIENWTSKPVARAQDVWNWICISGGWWGGGRCPTERELAPWLLFREGANLNNNNLIRMAQGIEYRFGRWGFNINQLAGFTAFFNPIGGIGDTTFGEADWNALMTPPSPYFQDIVETAYSRPIPAKGYIDDDGYYMYWFDQTDLDNTKMTANMLPDGVLFSTSYETGVSFYFTGNSDIFYCATRGINCKKP